MDTCSFSPITASTHTNIIRHGPRHTSLNHPSHPLQRTPPPRLTVSVPSTPSRPGGSGIGNVSSFSPSIGKCRITASSQFSNNHARQRSTSSSSPDSAPHPPERVQNGRSNHAGQNPPNSQSTMAVILSVAGSTSTLSWARSLWQKT